VTSRSKARQKKHQKLEQVKEASPLIGIMHSLKEELHQIFEESQNLSNILSKPYPASILDFARRLFEQEQGKPLSDKGFSRFDHSANFQTLNDSQNPYPIAGTKSDTRFAHASDRDFSSV